MATVAIATKKRGVEAIRFMEKFNNWENLSDKNGTHGVIVRYDICNVAVKLSTFERPERSFSCVFFAMAFKSVRDRLLLRPQR